MGLSINIISLSGNDGWQSAANKINDNFKNLYRALQTNGDSDLQFTKTGLQNDIKDTENRINQKIQDAVEEMNEIVEEAEKRLDKKIKDIASVADSAPPIGTWMYCEVNPSTKWPETTWEKYDEGFFIISAGEDYETGEKYGNKQISVPLQSHYHEMYSGGHYRIDAYYSGDYSFQTEWNKHNKLYQLPSEGDSGFYVAAHDITYNKPPEGSNSLQWRAINKTANTGIGNSKIDITPQSIAVPLWRRTA